MAKRSSKSTDIVEKAYNYAKSAHEGQKRTSGEPYFTHVEAVSKLLKNDLHADDETLAAALLHDTIEDTDVTYADLKKNFGIVIADLVEGITKVQRLQATMDKKEQNMQSIRMMFRTMGKDIRVIFIKLADRLHNMQTLHHVSAEKQIRVARETQDIYCPLANLLGIRQWYHELSDYCFQVLEPSRYDAIKRKSDMCTLTQQEKLNEWSAAFQGFLRMQGWDNAQVTAVPRHFRSIQEKVQGSETLLQNIETFRRIHVVIDNGQDCYACLGHVHAFSAPVPGQVDDFIASPKINGYQALHTTILSHTGNAIDVIVQTEEMSRQAQFGMASIYQSGADDIDMPGWVEAITSLEEGEQDLQSFFSAIQSDVFGRQIRIFLKGNTTRYLDVPAESSMLDVAYYLNEDTGKHATAATVNNTPVTLKHLVMEGDVVEITEDKNATMRTPEDLYYLRTSLAERLLSAELESERQEKKVSKGKALLNHAIDIGIDPFFSITWQKQMRNRVEMNPDVLADIATGAADPFLYLEDHMQPGDFFLLDPSCFQAASSMTSQFGMRYILHTSLDELRSGNVIGLQIGPDVIDVISADILAKERRFSREYVPLRVNKDACMFPFQFALRFTFETEANPLEGISTLQSMLDTPVKLLRFEPPYVTLGFSTDRLRTVQMAYEYLYQLPYISRIFRITP